MVLDESVASLEDVLDIHRRGLADGLTLKISRLGGITKTRLIRDIAVDLGFMITVEDTGGAEVDTAARCIISHPQAARSDRARANRRTPQMSGRAH